MTTEAKTRHRASGQRTRGAPASSRRAHRVQLTDRDLALLEFVAAQRFVLAAHVREWLGVSEAFAYRRLSRLAGVGLLNYQRIFHAQPGCYLITNGGLAVIDSALPRPSIDLRTYGHDLGVVWLWLGAREGRFGCPDRLLSERLMRSCEQGGDGAAVERFGVPVEGYDRSGRPRIHYPDVLVVAPDGGRVALELELSLKSRHRLERILVGYGGERRLRCVVYVTHSRSVANAVQGVAASFGLGDLIDVRYLSKPASELVAPDWPRGRFGGRVR
jgi:hypothetical protein